MTKEKAIKNALAKVGKDILREKFAISKGGNISVKAGHLMYITTKGALLGSNNPNDYICVDLQTEKVRGKGIPSSEHYLHSACYNKRKDVNAVLHLHPVFSTAAANSRIKLGPISYELLSCLESEIVRAKYKPAGTKALAKKIATLIRKANAILMPNHGLLVVGRNLNEAFERILAVERACQTLIFSRLLGLFKFMPAKEAKRILSLYK